VVRAGLLEAGQHLVHELHARVLVELDLLALVQRVVARIAVVRVVVVVGRVLGVVADLAAGEVRQHLVGVDERRPTPREHVVLALADRLGELAVVVDLAGRGDADLPQPAGDELSRRRAGDALAAHRVAEVERPAAAWHLADAVAVRVAVARVVEDLARLGQVEVEHLPVGDLRRPLRVGRDAQRLDRPREARRDPIDQRPLVDRVADRAAHTDVEQRRVRLLQAVAAVDPQLLHRALEALDRLDGRVLPQLLELVARDVEGRVELAALERGDHRVGVVELAQDDAVDRRPAAVEVRVGLEARELALLERSSTNGPEPTPSVASYFVIALSSYF